MLLTVACAAVGGAGTSPVTFVLLPFGIALTGFVAWRTRTRARYSEGTR